MDIEVFMASNFFDDLVKGLVGVATKAKQSYLTEKEIRQKQQEVAAEKRRVDEKQIRSLRNRYRPSGGFLNNQAPKSTVDLGGGTGLPNKLGE
jgi:hypothetical protein